MSIRIVPPEKVNRDRNFKLAGNAKHSIAASIRIHLLKREASFFYKNKTGISPLFQNSISVHSCRNLAATIAPKSGSPNHFFDHNTPLRTRYWLSIYGCGFNFGVQQGRQ